MIGIGSYFTVQQSACVILMFVKPLFHVILFYLLLLFFFFNVVSPGLHFLSVIKDIEGTNI